MIRELLQINGCLLGGIAWAMCIHRWAPPTLTWLLIGVIPSIILVLIGGFLVLKYRYPPLFR